MASHSGGSVLSGRFDPFRPLSRSQRAASGPRFVEALARRDGDLDFVARTLSRREREHRVRNRNVRWRGQLDRDQFRKSLRGRRADGDDPRIVWLVAAARSNQAESWAVDVDIRAHIRRGMERTDLAERYILVEEQYHARILEDVCRTLGVELESQRPAWFTRGFVHLLTKLPGRLRYIPVLCGEVLGAVVFTILRDRSDLFDAEPEVAAHLRSLMNEILEDETLHVAYCRSRLGPFAIAIARSLAGQVARVIMSDVPELAGLGCDRRQLRERIRAGLEAPPSLPWLAESG